MDLDPSFKDTVAKLNISAQLLKSWESSKFSNGRTLSETLTIEKIPLWEAIVSELAHLYIPNAIWYKSKTSFFKEKIRPPLTRLKHRILNRIDIQKNTRVATSWSDEPVCLFIASSLYQYRDILQPIVECMQTTPGLHPISITDQTSVQNEFEEVQSIWQYWNHDVEISVKSFRKKFKCVVKELLQDDALPQITRDHQGNTLWSEVKPVFNWLFQTYLPILIPQAIIATHILKKYRPALIISPDVNDPRARLYCLLGQTMGIASLEIQMGDYDEGAIEWRFFVASRLAVWGKKSYDVLRQHGVPGERMVITGSPRYDHKGKTDQEIKQIRSQLGIADGTLMILFASVYDGNNTGCEVFRNPETPNVIAEMKEGIFQAANQVEGIALVVKPHPLENVEETKKIAGKNRNIQFVDRNVGIIDLISICDIFMAVTGSTTVTNALFDDKLVIIPVFPGWPWSRQYEESEAVLIPKSKEEILAYFKRAVDKKWRDSIKAELKPAMQRYQQDYFYKTDRRASNRIVKLALEMTKLKYEGSLEK